MIVALTIGLTLAYANADWKPAKGPLQTRWANKVSIDKPLPEYPRPQMVRKEWLNLNGLWDFEIATIESTQPTAYSSKIRVPFPVESALSGVMKPVTGKSTVWYHRSVEVPTQWHGKRLLLHFGASDWKTTVYVNGNRVGSHTGGYDPFTMDITTAVGDKAKADIVVSVWDPTDVGYQPHGKQVLNPGGIMYTAVTGIWQTVWLEPVGESSIDSFKMVPNVDRGGLQLDVSVSGQDKPLKVEAEVFDKGLLVSKEVLVSGQNGFVPVENAKLWSPDSPYLYDLKLTLRDGKGHKLDEIKSYFAMRKVSLGRDKNGRTRICLNNKLLFMAGPLDQGFWPDGIYTAPTDGALKYDIELTKKLGFNMARKHVKVESARWYYWCDRLGLLVWQDMPAGDSGRNQESSENFGQELRSMIESLYNVPSIVMWIVYNEGWGQHQTEKFVAQARELDKSRLISNASGWTDRKVGDIIDWHVYPGPGSPSPERYRAAVLGEFGGLGLPLKGHMWKDNGNWGYVSYSDRSKLTEEMVKLWQNTALLIGTEGLSGAVYTQTTDVEIEANGIMTYDREIVKPDASKLRQAVVACYQPPQALVVVVPQAQQGVQEWKYSLAKPANDWNKMGFNDLSWKAGQSGFGTDFTPNTTVRTTWDTDDIWLRRIIDLPKSIDAQDLKFSIYHDEDAEVFIDGVLAAKLTGYVTGYVLVDISKEAKLKLTSGKHVLAIHCRQTSGGQYIDAGIVQVVHAK